jgi:hypothetical protein
MRAHVHAHVPVSFCANAYPPACSSISCPSPPPRRTITGMAHSFFTSANARLGKQLLQVLEEAGQVVPPELRSYAMSGGGGGSKWGEAWHVQGSLVG